MDNDAFTAKSAAIKLLNVVAQIAIVSVASGVGSWVYNVYIYPHNLFAILYSIAVPVLVAIALNRSSAIKIAMAAILWMLAFFVFGAVKVLFGFS